ncbi:FtsX-like permease family protein [Cellulomonas sp. NPDC058312]|uniref:FtsX-like permease family protein n=1 Tax=Cellulomonas sp. NPDC058312 TaxID=3346441 RepID=UPI0036E2516E
MRHHLAAPALVALVVAGCAPSPTTPAPDASWSEPGWMAEQAQRAEQFVVRLQACMDGRGWQLTVDESAGFAEPFASQAEAERAGADRDACLVEQGIDTSFVSEPLTAETLTTAAGVAGRRRDLGRQRALGASRSAIVALVVLQSAVAGAAGAVAGTAAGTLLVLQTSGRVLPWGFAAGVVVLSGVVGVVGAVPSAVLAARRDPVRILRVP